MSTVFFIIGMTLAYWAIVWVVERLKKIEDRYVEEEIAKIETNEEEYWTYFEKELVELYNSEGDRK